MSAERRLHWLRMDSPVRTRREDITAGLESGTWEEFVARHLTDYERRAEKKGACFTPARYRPPTDWAVSERVNRWGKASGSVRLDANVEAVGMAVLDLDKPGALEKARRVFAGREHVLHRTFSWTPEKPHKYRLVAPLAEDVPGGEWAAHVLGLAEACDADVVCRNPSRIYYLPACPEGADWSGTIERVRGPWADRAFLLSHKASLPLDGGPRERAAKRCAPSPGRTAPAVSGSADPTRVGWTEGVSGFSDADLSARFEGAVQNLDRDDSRHGFALRATMAMAHHPVRCGDEKEVTTLTAWMLRTANRHGSRPMESGNTLVELPEMFASAWLKARGTVLSESAARAWVGNAAAAYRKGIDPAEPNGEAANPWGERYEAMWRRVSGPVSAQAAVALVEADAKKAGAPCEPLAVLCLTRRWGAVHGGDPKGGMDALRQRFGHGDPAWEAAWRTVQKLPKPSSPASSCTSPRNC